MNLKSLNSELRNRAIDKGICEPILKEWRNDWELDRMVRQFYRTIDFFIQKRFISNEFIKEHFDKIFLRDNGIIVDDRYSLVNKKNIIIMGDSTSTVRMNGNNACTVNILDNSNVKLEAKGRSFIMAHVFGNTQVEAKCLDLATVVVITHSHDAVIVADRNVSVKEEYGYLK